MEAAYTCAALVVLAYELMRQRDLPVDWLTMFNLYAGVYYFAVPIAHLYGPETLHWRGLALFPEATESVLTFCAVVVAHVAVVAGYEIGRRLRHAQIQVAAPALTDRFVFGYSVAVIVAFGVVSIALAMSSGGIVNAILASAEFRAGRASRGLGSYVQYVFDAAPFVLLLIFGASRNSGLSAALRVPILFVSLIIVVYLALTSAGRGRLLMPFVLLYLAWLNETAGRRKLLASALTVLLVAMGAFVVAYGKSAFWELDSLPEGPRIFVQRVVERQTRLFGDASLSTGMAAVLGQFDHQFASLYVAIDHPEVYEAPRLLLDWPRAVVSYAPGLEQPDFIVTSTPAGHGRDVFRQEGMLSAGYVPPGWVAMHYINGLWLGLVLIPLVAGCMGGWIDRMLSASSRDSGWQRGAYIAFGWLWLMYGLGADPFTAVPTVLILLATFLILIPHVRFRRPGVSGAVSGH